MSVRCQVVVALLGCVVVRNASPTMIDRQGALLPLCALAIAHALQSGSWVHPTVWLTYGQVAGWCVCVRQTRIDFVVGGRIVCVCV